MNAHLVVKIVSNAMTTLVPATLALLLHMLCPKLTASAQKITMSKTVSALRISLSAPEDNTLTLEKSALLALVISAKIAKIFMLPAWNVLQLMYFTVVPAVAQMTILTMDLSVRTKPWVALPVSTLIWKTSAKIALKTVFTALKVLVIVESVLLVTFFQKPVAVSYRMMKIALTLTDPSEIQMAA